MVVRRAMSIRRANPARSKRAVPEHLDYRVWNVAYADGTSVRFDSVLGEALLD